MYRMIQELNWMIDGIPREVLLVLFISLMILKGIALWRAAQLSQGIWFSILLFANTMGILELIYIYGITRKYSVEVTKE